MQLIREWASVSSIRDILAVVVAIAMPLTVIYFASMSY